VNLFLLNVVLAFAWAIVNGSLTARDVSIGFIIGYLILWLVSPALGQFAYHERVPKLPRFAIWYLGELVRTNVSVAMAVLSPRLNQHPGIVAVPLDCESDFEITTVANLFSLTPGSVSLSVSRDRRTLYVHVMDLDLRYLDDFRREVKVGIEQRVLALIRGEARACEPSRRRR